MKTINIVILITFSIAWLLYISDTTIKFKPFSFSMENPLIGLSWFLMIVAIIVMQAGFTKIGHKEGVQHTVKEINKILDEAAERKKQEIK